MSKGNLFLGMGRGKVGDVVFSRQNGEQVTRVRNRAPRNPQTPLQLLQRVVMKTTSGAYSLMQDICNHSFQGLREGTPNQTRFIRLNVEKLRNQLADEINSGEAADILTSGKVNFSRKNNNLCELNSYIISEGTINKLPVVLTASGNQHSLYLPGVAASQVSTLTYQQLVDALGLQRGDQLTFCIFGADDSEEAGDNGRDGKWVAFEYARVILEPNDGDMTSVFLVLPEGSTQYVINKPNPKNEGNMLFSINSTTVPGVTGSSVVIDWASTTISATNRGIGVIDMGGAVIASRYNGGIWERSNAEIVIVPGTGIRQYDYEVDTLGDAVLSYMAGVNSSLYLNQSE